MIPKRTGTEDVFSPFALKDCYAGAQRIVDNDQKLCQLKGPDDQIEQRFEKDFGPELETRKETVVAGFVTPPRGVRAQAADVPLAGLDQPGNGRRQKIRPASFGKRQTKTEDYFGKVRCRLVGNHSPFLPMCEMLSQHSTSENGLFFLSMSSFVNP